MTDLKAQPFIFATPRLYLSCLDPESPQHCFFIIGLWNSPLFVEFEGEIGIVTHEEAKEYTAVLPYRLPAQWLRSISHGPETLVESIN
jgi:hypothetical protein